MTSVHLIRQPYHGERGAPDRSDAPTFVDDEQLHATLRAGGVDDVSSVEVSLTSDENSQYGEWQRVALANAHLARHVADALEFGALPIGLLANCNSLPGMLAGVQRHLGDDAQVGLIWIDAHADFNTPETTLSGMLGGMPVALSCGLCLHRLRETAGMTRPIDPAHVLMVGLRDVDPQERALLEEHGVGQLDLGDDAIATAPSILKFAESLDTIYVHIDMDVLDPADVPGHPLTVPGGPAAATLGTMLATLLQSPIVAAAGIASTPTPDRDEQGRARNSAHHLIGMMATGHRTRGRA